MRKICNWVFILCLCSVVGCAWFKGSSKPVKSSEGQKFVYEGKIINKDRLKEGGGLTILAFKAGPDVEATDELDKISLRIVKGIAEVISGQSTSLKIVTAEKASQADFIIEGHINTLDEPSKVGRLILRHKKKRLVVTGKLVEKKNIGPIAIFQDKKETRNKKENFEDLGYSIGADIGNFILSGTH